MKAMFTILTTDLLKVTASHRKNFGTAFVLTFLVLLAAMPALAITFGNSGSEVWEYNPGPDPNTPEGKALIDLYAELPEYSEMSNAIMDDQKFRYIFGMMMTRTSFEKNGVKILFVGQDATHIAEAAKQPGTSGFGARVQSVGNFFGVDQGVSTTNAFLSTIKGQYGSFDAPYLEIDASGKPNVRQGSFVDNQLWMLANSPDSEIRKKREAFWEWMIKNNPDSMRMMVVFGGAARDAFAEFLIARGAKVGTRVDSDRVSHIRVPEMKLVYAGGNNEFPVPVTKDGKDIYSILAGRRLNYENVKDQQLVQGLLRDNLKKATELMVFTGGGTSGSGIITPAQLGGYDLSDVEINGKRTHSLKGLVLSDGYVVKDHIGFVLSAHPSSLSRMSDADASAVLEKSFAPLKDLKAQGWFIEPDIDIDGKPRVNAWAEGKQYQYGRADIRQGYFEFGAPDDRRVSRADASRLDPQVIVAGTRNRPKFDKALIESAKERLPSEPINPEDLFSNRPRQPESRGVFDRGPGDEVAKALQTSIDRELLFKPKPGMEINDGIDAYNTKTNPATGLFGFHRGSFQDAKVLILADPHGMDDWLTSRALTGARGQYLNGLMSDFGIGEQYLVLKTVPVGMDGATAEEWEVVRKSTETYREVAIREALKSGKVQAVFTDGEIAAKEMKRVLAKLKVKLPVVDIRREGLEPASGIADAAREVQQKWGWAKGKSIEPHMKDIPRAHLTWWSRIWEGTGGDRVIEATGKDRGGVRLVVAPNWVARQKVRISKVTQVSIESIKKKMETMGLRGGQEKLETFLARRQIEGWLNLKDMLTTSVATKEIPMCSAIYK